MAYAIKGLANRTWEPIENEFLSWLNAATSLEWRRTDDHGAGTHTDSLSKLHAQLDTQGIDGYAVHTVATDYGALPFAMRSTSNSKGFFVRMRRELIVDGTTQQLKSEWDTLKKHNYLNEYLYIILDCEITKHGRTTAYIVPSSRISGWVHSYLTDNVKQLDATCLPKEWSLYSDKVVTSTGEDGISNAYMLHIPWKAIAGMASKSFDIVERNGEYTITNTDRNTVKPLTEIFAEEMDTIPEMNTSTEIKGYLPDGFYAEEYGSLHN